MSTSERYTAVAIVLHWAIAIAILLNLAAGWWMTDAIHDPATKAQAIAAFQVHKSLGLAILALSLMRLAWRLMHRPPALPEGMASWERLAASATHWALYAFMIGVPLTGWILVSTQWSDNGPRSVPTYFFGLVQVPHVFGLPEASPELRKQLFEQMEELHEVLAFGIAALFAGHVAAALRHQFVKRDHLMARLKPGLASVAALLVLATGFVLGVRHVNASVGIGAPAAAAEAGSLQSAAGSWIVDSSSRIEFVGTNSGAEFRGYWAKWSADIRYDAANPANSTISATIDTSSAKTGVSMQEEALPQEEWFNVAKFPTATFKSTKVGPDGAIEGTLTIKGHELPVSGLVATVEDGVLKITGRTEVDRKAADLGLSSDPTGDYVGLKVGVEVNVTAKEPK